MDLHDKSAIVIFFIPSDKLTELNGKSPSLVGKSTLCAIFSSKLLSYQRVLMWVKQ